ncbi:MAG: hypothetical protein ACYSUQ_05070, partial [Planctomycetota bacterium]
MSLFRAHWPALVAVGLLLAAVCICVLQSLSRNDGNLIYAIDDPYIHMTIARNVVQAGVWGINRDAFASCSSSPLWTLLLTGVYLAVGISEAAPLVLNVIAATGLLILIGVLLRKRAFHPAYIIATLICIIYFVPLLPVVFCGMEHVLHMLATLYFAHLATRLLTESTGRLPERKILLLLAPLLTMIRYEAMFLLAVVGVMLLARRRLVFAILLGLCGLLPIAVSGLISVSKGWYFFPNSVMLKGNIPSLSSSRALFTLFDEFSHARNWHLLFLMVLSVIVAGRHVRRQGRLWTYPAVVNILFVATTILHVQFARTGWLFRYEAYLMVLGIYAVAVGLKQSLAGDRPSRSPLVGLWNLALVLAAVGTAFFLAQRGTYALDRMLAAANDIYKQQYQMGLFLARYYPTETVGANDIGALNHLSDVRCVDLYGLGSMAVARARRAGEYDREAIGQIADREGVRIALVHKSWFDHQGGLPESWILCGKWRLEENYICFEERVWIYALNRQDAKILVDNLEEFAADLPVG